MGDHVHNEPDSGRLRTLQSVRTEGKSHNEGQNKPNMLSRIKTAVRLVGTSFIMLCDCRL